MKVGVTILLAGLLAGPLACGVSDRSDDRPREPDHVAEADDGPNRGATPWTPGPDLPQPVANNAVAGLVVDGRPEVYSFLGLDSTRIWSGVGSWAFRWRMDEPGWTVLPPVPGPGRLAATAQAVAGRVYVFGGYTVDSTGAEASLPNVDVFDPRTDQWFSGAPIPVPVDDAVSGVWADSLIYLVSGWHNESNVPDVQIYDVAGDRWSAADRIPGPPVFGHTGGISNDLIVYVDGAEVVSGSPRYRLAPSSWLGVLTPEEPGRVEWTRLAPHPGPPLYRAASVGLPEGVLFYGGTGNPYNYNGIGYDGVPAEARTQGFMFRSSDRSWRELPPLPAPSMDHRGLVHVADRILLVGGMDGRRTVAGRVWQAPADELIDSALNPGR